jgi:flavorubredoxin
MKATVVYYSMFGNTEKVAKALAAGLESGGVGVEVANVETAKIDELDETDLLCAGSPLQAWTSSKPVKEFLDRLKSVKGLSGKKAFAFETKLRMRLAGSATEKIEKKLKDIGLTAARHGESAFVKDREGPLEENAEGTFRQIGAELAKLPLA